MAGITSVVTPIFSGLVQGALQGASQQQQDLLSAKQLAARQQLTEQQAAADAASRAAQLRTDAASASEKRRQSLARGLAKARAYFAGQGIDPDSGSAAVLAQSETADTEAEDTAAQTELQQRMDDINRSYADLVNSNLLQRSQTAQRRRLFG
jgi:hypothetical protein